MSITGYQVASGVFFDQDEPFRFLRPSNFVSPIGGNTSRLLAFSGSALPERALSNSAWRFKYYHYDEWQSKVTTLTQLYHSNGLNISSGLLNWMRSEEPFVWYYYDLGAKGNYTRRLLKNVSFPFDDISVPSGSLPVNFSGLPPIESQETNLGLADALVPYLAVEKLPWYQSAGLVKQVQDKFGAMFASPIANSVHPANVSLSGVSVPAVALEYALSLNNLNLKPTDWLPARPTNVTRKGSVLPGSGHYEPVLDMAQQVNYPVEYISNINNVITLNIPSSHSNFSFCDYHAGPTGGGSQDYFLSLLHFGFMEPTDIDIEVSANISPVVISGTKCDAFNNCTNVTWTYSPVLVAKLESYGDSSPPRGSSPLNGALPLTSDGNTIGQIVGKTGSMSYTIKSSGSTYSTTGFDAPLDPTTFQPTGTVITNASGNILEGFNSFIRVFDPLDTKNTAYFVHQTTNYRLTNQIGWTITAFPPSCGIGDCFGLNNFPGDFINGGTPSFSIDPAAISISVNGVNVPAKKEGKLLPSYTFLAIPLQPVAPASSKLECWDIIGGTITINYSGPSFLGCFYQYDTAVPLKSGIKMCGAKCDEIAGPINCFCIDQCWFDKNKCVSFTHSRCVSYVTTSFINGNFIVSHSNCCKPLPLNPVEVNLGGVFAGCPPDPCSVSSPNPFGSIGILGDIGSDTGCTYSKVYQWIIPGPTTVTVKNGCGFELFGAGVALEPWTKGSGTCNAWTTFSYSKTFDFRTGCNGNLNSWQDISVSASIGVSAQCTMQPTEIWNWAKQQCDGGTPSATTITCGCGGPWKKIPSPGSEMSASDFYTWTLPGTAANCDLGCCGDSVNEYCCFPCLPYQNQVCPCPSGTGNFIVTDAGQSVSIDSIDCNFVVQCPDGSQTNVNFSLGGVSVTVPAPFQPDVTVTNSNAGSAPSACGSWWN